MDKPIKDHTSTKILSGVTLLLLAVSILRPWDIAGGMIVFFLVWSSACWLYIEDMYDKDLRIYNLQVSKMSGQFVPVLQEDKDVTTTKKDSHIDIVPPRNDLLADDWECYKVLMHCTPIQTLYKQPVNTTELVEDYKFKKEEQKQVSVAEEVENTKLVQDICQCHIGKDYTGESLLQLDEEISRKLDAKFKEKGIN